jgi:nicotinate dehydrogenase subunit B
MVAWNGTAYSGATLAAVDNASAANLPGVVAIVTRGNFVGVVARTAQQARQAAAALRVSWHSAPKPSAPGKTGSGNTLVSTRTLFEKGEQPDVPGVAVTRSYAWPADDTTDIDASWAIAAASGKSIDVWAPSAAAGIARADIAALLGLSEASVVVHTDPATLRHSNHAAGIAALLAQAAGGAVRVDLSPADTWVDTPAAQETVSHISGTTHGEPSLSSYSYTLPRHMPQAPSLALLLTNTRAPVQELGIALGPAAIPPYAYAHVRVAAPDVADTANAPYDAERLAKAHVFAHESYIDEAAHAAHTDPVDYRLAQLHDPKGEALIKAVAGSAAWTASSAAPQTGTLQGRGFAYANVLDDSAGSPVQTWSAWVADVTYDTRSGDLSVTRVVVGQDMDAVSAPSSTATRLEDTASAAVSALLQGPASYETWGNAPGSQAVALASAAPPSVEVVSAGPLQTGQARLAAGAAFALPAAAAVSNAIFDATGIRLRQPPFTGERVQQALQLQVQEKSGKAKKRLAFGAAAGAALGSLFVLAMPFRSAIAPIEPIGRTLYSEATIERGRLVAAAGDCMVCHTAVNGTPNAGGRPLDTPFGTIYSTNITPDVETGIGNWSYVAFERARREGIHRDGKHLYPAFPYTAFAKTSDADIQALYAYLMVQPAVSAKAPDTKLAFPFNIRPLMAGWNAMFHKAEAFKPDPDQSTLWNRGAYLAQGLGHCGACHTPRNALGAEKTGPAYLTGGVADGWEAPALTSLSKAPIPWTEAELFKYLRHGNSTQHGVAAGPMAPVVEEMAHLPDTDIQAIAHYIASFNEPGITPAETAARAAELEQKSTLAALGLRGTGSNIFQGACAVCHSAGSGPKLFGASPSLAVNSNLHSATPDNLVRVILEGISTPAHNDLGYMPGFADSLGDSQVTELVNYVRSRFASDKQPWTGVEKTVARIRAEAAAHSR